MIVTVLSVDDQRSMGTVSSGPVSYLWVSSGWSSRRTDVLGCIQPSESHCPDNAAYSSAKDC